MTSHSSAGTFWEWFQRHEGDLWRIEDYQDEWLDRLQAALAEYRQGLWVEVSDEDEGVRELVISAAGDEQLFDDARDLVAHAPELKRWKVLALKPARGFDFMFEDDSVKLDPRELAFEPLAHARNPRAIGLRVFSPVLGDNVRAAVERMLEVGLGEEKRARISYIEIAPLPSDSKKYIAVGELGEYIEWFERKLPPMSGPH